MCGICGIVDFTHPIEFGVPRVEAMCKTLRHRGPDDKGTLFLPYAMLAMRRLRVIDLEGGRQPISNENGRVHIIYNGETYNFQDLRESLIGDGHVFKTRSDTEVALHLFEEYGCDAPRLMNGMFALAILDDLDRRLFLARDRLGVKPLYYYHNAGRLYFASEIKALLAHPDVPREIDLQSLGFYLAHLYIPGERTIYKGIRRLLPGHFIEFTGGDVTPRPYWSLPLETRSITEPEAREELIALLKDAVRLRLISDVPVGVFLSGGIDSSAITALMSLAAGGHVKSFSVGFEERGFDERRYARQVAERYGAEHQEIVVPYPDIPVILPKLARCFDQPFADPSAIPTFVLSQFARGQVTVALSGNGGDELFGGYSKYLSEKIYGSLRMVPTPMRRMAAGALDRLGETPNLADRNRRMKRVLRYSLMPEMIRAASWTVGFDILAQHLLFRPEALRYVRLKQTFEPWMRHVRDASALDSVSRLLYMDIKTYLPDNNLVKDDVMGMANSLEIRTPFLDYRIAEFAASLPIELKIKGFQLKYILKQAMKYYLPENILRRSKQGFTVPVGHWINGKLSDYVNQMLDPKSAPFADYFRPKAIRQLLADHRSGRADNGMRIWALLVLRAWHEESRLDVLVK